MKLHIGAFGFSVKGPHSIKSFCNHQLQGLRVPVERCGGPAGGAGQEPRLPKQKTVVKEGPECFQ